MRHGVVEGEPGVFPAPVAKVMRAIGGLFSRKKHEPTPPAPGSSESDTPLSDTPLSDLDPKPPADRD